MIEELKAPVWSRAIRPMIHRIVAEPSEPVQDTRELNCKVCGSLVVFMRVGAHGQPDNVPNVLDDRSPWIPRSGTSDGAVCCYYIYRFRLQREDGDLS